MRLEPLNRGTRDAARWLAPLLAGCVAYFSLMAAHGLVRGFADNVNGGRSYSLVPVSESTLGGITAERLQRLLGTDNTLLAEASFEVWFSLFWVTPLLALIAYSFGGPRAFYQLLAVHAVVVFTSDIFYALFPTRPPWMDADVTRLVALQVDAVGSDANPYAALPSLHVAVPVAYATWFWRQRDPRLRAIAPSLFVWCAAMAFAVIYTGEHYLYCVVLGALLAVEVNLVLARVHLGDVWPWRAAARDGARVRAFGWSPAAVPIAASDD